MKYKKVIIEASVSYSNTYPQGKIWYSAAMNAETVIRDMRKALADCGATLEIKNVKFTNNVTPSEGNVTCTPDKVVIRVEGGVAELIECPEYISVDIIDIDNLKAGE